MKTGKNIQFAVIVEFYFVILTAAVVFTCFFPKLCWAHPVLSLDRRAMEQESTQVMENLFAILQQDR